MREIPVEGMQVDLFDKVQNNWVEGAIEKVERSGDQVRITVSRKGFPPQYNSVVSWPDAKAVDFCGVKIQDRICNEKSKKPAIEIFEAKVCFTPLDYCEDIESLEGAPPSWMIDQGKTFGEKSFNSKKFKYGWSRDMSTMARKRDINDDILLDSFLMFPPSTYHPLCQAANPELSCDSTQWSIEVPIGKYAVKITFGDAEKVSAFEF